MTRRYISRNALIPVKDEQGITHIRVIGRTYNVGRNRQKRMNRAYEISFKTT